MIRIDSSNIQVVDLGDTPFLPIDDSNDLVLYTRAVDH
jgi:hypothetical protein